MSVANNVNISMACHTISLFLISAVFSWPEVQRSYVLFHVFIWGTQVLFSCGPVILLGFDEAGSISIRSAGEREEGSHVRALKWATSLLLTSVG